MATVELRFSAQPEHVRTARLVAAAVARRAGVDEAVLDEVRLAVGEACSRAVGLHRSHGVDAPIRVVLTDEEKAFSIEVGDEVPLPGISGSQDASGGARGVEEDADGEDEMGLAVIRGLVDDMDVSSSGVGGVIRMSWPTTPASLLA
ncbi:ATP-binding protein [Streptomyces sp. NPDC005963]|uniref:ATP-binding protein n=1 Tax=Streptomyces sp. NPDC005963 TaxID=3156721 RepID=UPI0033D4E6CC